MSHPSNNVCRALLACLVLGACTGGESASSGAPTAVPSDTPPVDIPPDDPGCDGLTDLPGDCFAIAPPAPGEGYQAHYGPDDYDDPDQVSAFVIEEGAELVDCAYRVLDNTDTEYFQRYTVSSRPGMHHIILYALSPGAASDGMRDDCSVKNKGARVLGVLHGGISGSTYEYPPSGEIAEENVGLGTPLTPGQVIAFEMHAVNPQSEPLLRESWANFYVMPPDSVTEIAGQVIFNGGLGMRIPPETTQVIENGCSAPDSEIRLLEIFGHMHAHGVRFSAFKTTPDASAEAAETRTLIYESYDWSDLDRQEFNSAVENPLPEYQSGNDGAYTGILTFSPGERLEYECEIANTEDFELRYSIGAYTGEMCNVFGAYAPDTGTPWTCAN